MDKNFERLRSLLDKWGKEWHNEIEAIINEIKFEIYQTNSNDVCVVSKYKSRNSEFKKLPPKFPFSFPTLLTNKTEFRETFGTLSASYITTQERFYTMESPDVHSNSPLGRQLLDDPVILTTIDTGSGYLYSVVCINDEKILIKERHMKIFNLQGKLLQSIQSKSSGRPSDIAVTKDGDIVYTDGSDNTVNVVKIPRYRL